MSCSSSYDALGHGHLWVLQALVTVEIAYEADGGVSGVEIHFDTSNSLELCAYLFPRRFVV